MKKRSKQELFSSFPFNGNFLGGFSIQWKNFWAFFHSMETFGSNFPFNGKILAWFSTQWKFLGAIFHSMETRLRSAAAGLAPPCACHKPALEGGALRRRSLMALFFISLATASIAQGQGSESFDNHTAPGNTYASGTYTGDGGVSWSYSGARNPSAAFQIDGKSIGFGTTSHNPRYVNATVSGGVGSVTYKTRSYFTGGSAANRTIQLWVDGNLEESFTLPAMGTIYTRTVSGIDAAGTVEIEFRATGSRQIVLDTVSWTGYVPATDLPPTMGVLDITDIGSTTATFESEVTDDGGASVTARGFVYSLTSTNDDPLIGGSGVTQVSSGSGTGVFDEDITGLTVGSEYSVKAYATNSEGTTYTPVETFTTFPALTAFFDPYEQNFSGFNSAATIPAGWEVTDDTYADDWGVGTGMGLRGNDNVLGYQHTASSGNFTITLTLVNETGSTIENLFVEYMGMVERTGVGRSPEWTVEVDGSEVAALFYSTSGNVDELVSTTVSGLSIANGETFTITWTSDRGGPSGASKQIGISDVHVEAVSATAPPTVTTDEPTAIDTVSATVGGEVTGDGGATVTERGVAYNTTGMPTTSDSTLVIGSGMGTFSTTLSGLTPGETYYVRAYATNSEGTAYGDEEEFTTDCFGAPTGLTATGVSFEEFTAEWNAVSGATGYRLDVSTNASFGIVGSEENILDEGLDESGAPTGWSENDINWQSADGGYARFDEVGSWLETPVLDLSGYQNVELSFRVAKWGSGDDGPITVQVSLDGGSTWGQTFDSPTPISSTYSNSGPTAISPLSDQVVFRFSREDSPSRKRFQNVLLTGEPVTPDFVPGYENLLVTGTSQLVDGLEEGVEYFFRVRAESSNCLSANSDVESVTTPERPIPRISINSLVHDETVYMASGRVVTNYMFVYANDETLFAFDGSQGLDRVFEVTDAWLANLSAANDLQIHFGSWDPDHGLNRSASPPVGQEHLYTRMTVENWFTDNFSGFDASLSSPDPVISTNAATNVWRFVSPVAGATINAMMADSNRISATIVNTVGGTREDQQFGWLNVFDDDTEPPQVGSQGLTVMLDGVALPSVQIDERVAGWNFNNTADRQTVNHGAGTLTYIDLNGTIGDNGGSSINLVPDDIAGRDLTLSGVNNIGGSLQFDVDMTGLEDLVVTFAAQRSATGYDDNTVAFSVNNGPFTTVDASWAPPTSFALQTFDLSGYPEINGAGSVRFRITFGIDTATGGGNNRFDNFQFNATRRVSQITDSQLLSVGAGTPLDFSLNVFDAHSGLHRGDSSDDRNMRIAITGITTNNYDFVPSLSSADTTLSTATSVWRFTSSFTTNDVGELFGDGTNYLSVTVTVSDTDNDRPNDNLWISNRLVGTFMVIDDDTDPPEIANVNFPGAAARPFMILTNGVASPSGEVIRGGQLRRDGTGVDTVFKVSDFDLANSGTIGLQFVFGAVDADSGVARGNVGTTNTVMTFSIGDLYDGDVFLGQYDSGLSSPAAGPGEVATNVWTFPNGFFTFAMIDALIEAGRQPIYVTIPDTDNDRPGDQAVLYSAKVGYLQVIDDDIRGPIISSAGIRGAIDEDAILFSAFEASEGWPPPFQPTTGSHSWTNVVAGRTWIGRGAFRTTFPPILSGVQRFGLLTSTYSDPWLQLPPVDNPGVLSLYAGRFGQEAQDITIRVERFDGSTWVGMGDRVVTNRDPTYELYTWDLDFEGEDVLLRIARDVGSGNQVYLEDISVVPRSQWISTNQLDIFWREAVDDFNAVDEYRLITPGFATVTPTEKTDGFHVAASVTNYLTSIMGQQGELTGYLFAIDDDDDRPGDRAMGNIIRLVARVDTNPPIAISDFEVAEDENIDDLSEVRLEWSTPGGSEAEGAGWRQSDSEPLSPWRSYRIYYTSENRDPTLEDPFADVTEYVDLGDYETDSVVLTDFAFGTSYRMAIAGEDEAGNIGDLSDAITHQFAAFVVTQGVAVAETESRIYWQASEGREYDLIFADANDYSENLNGDWDLSDRAETNAITDIVSLNGDAMRFYRASPAGRWEPPSEMAPMSGNGPSGLRRIASEEVYVAKPITLHRGQNWVALPGIPDELTVGRAFQSALNLPSGETAATSTRITWFDRNQGTNVARQIWLSGNEWRTNETHPQSAMDDPIDLADGVVIEIPMDAAYETYSFLFVGRVPSSAVPEHEQTQTIVPNNAYNLVSARLPRFMHPSELNLVESGFKAGLGVSSTLSSSERADAVWALDRADQGPAGIVYYNDGTTASTFPVAGWYRVGDGGATSVNRVNGTPFAPDDAIVLRTFGSTSAWTWTNTIPYAAPTQFLD